LALESATYIDTLNVSNPAAADVLSQADDHIRMLKAVLKNTFPLINGVCNATPLQLNQGFVPIGAIVMWSGNPASLPTGWRLCDGTTHARTDGAGNITTPDLRNVFVRGSGASNAAPATAPAPGVTGGVDSNTPAVTLTPVALTQAQLPNYALPVTDPGHTHTATVTDPGHNHTRTYTNFLLAPGGFSTPTPATAAASPNFNSGTSVTGISVANASNTTGLTVNSGGSGQTHNHAVSASAMDNKPPFYTLAFIIKI
jgi:hypothetical protein